MNLLKPKAVSGVARTRYRIVFRSVPTEGRTHFERKLPLYKSVHYALVRLYMEGDFSDA